MSVFHGRPKTILTISDEKALSKVETTLYPRLDAVSDEKELPYHLQGNPDFDRASKVEQRQALRHQPIIEKVLLVWWATAINSCRSSLKRGKDGEIPKEVMTQISRKLYRALVEHWDAQDARDNAESEWAAEMGDTKEIGRERFMDSIFEVADQWTFGIEEGEYVDFLWRLLCRITTGEPPSARWLEEEEICFCGSEFDAWSGADPNVARRLDDIEGGDLDKWGRQRASAGLSSHRWSRTSARSSATLSGPGASQRDSIPSKGEQGELTSMRNSIGESVSMVESLRLEPPPDVLITGNAGAGLAPGYAESCPLVPGGATLGPNSPMSSTVHATFMARQGESITTASGVLSTTPERIATRNPLHNQQPRPSTRSWMTSMGMQLSRLSRTSGGRYAVDPSTKASVDTSRPRTHHSPGGRTCTDGRPPEASKQATAQTSQGQGQPVAQSKGSTFWLATPRLTRLGQTQKVWPTTESVATRSMPALTRREQTVAKLHSQPDACADIHGRRGKRLGKGHTSEAG